MGRGDTENGSEELDNLLLYLGLQLSHVQILNVQKKLMTPDIECLHVSLTFVEFNLLNNFATCHKSYRTTLIHSGVLYEVAKRTRRP